MHPLVLPAVARHRRELSTRQRVRLAVAILLGIATLAAIGVFGSQPATQAKVLDWLAVRGISLALAGWALYALPFAALVGVISPKRGPVPRLLAGLALGPALVAAAVMSRPRRTSVAEWQTALGPGAADFVQAAQLTAYVLLGVAVIWAVGSTIAHLAAKPAPIDDTLLRLRRSATRAALFALAASLAVIALA